MQLLGDQLKSALEVIKREHYAHSVPSGKRVVFEYEGVIAIYALPANNNISRFLTGKDNRVWELSRLWAPDNHRKNLMTEALSKTIAEFHGLHPEILALVSYADPNVGHGGGIYRAASWDYLGQCEEGRYYRDASGQVVSRRSFHSGSTFLKKSEILARGFVEMKRPGKHRFARGLTRAARAAIKPRVKPYPTLF